MRHFARTVLFLLLTGICIAQSAQDTTRTTPSFSESQEFRSQISAYLTGSKKVKAEAYSLPEHKLGEEVETVPITLSVSVLDDEARPVSNLGQSDFSVTIDGTDCGIRTVEKVRNPVHVIFLLDRSPSSGDLLRMMRQNAKAILRDLPPDSVVSVATFSGNLKFKAERTQDKSLIVNEFEKIKDFEDGTSLYDALTSLAKTSALNNHDTSVVLITDGVDTTSFKSIADSFAHLERAKFAIYPVYLDTYSEYLKSPSASGQKQGSAVPWLGRIWVGSPKLSQEEWEMGKMYLNDIASLSSGRPVAASTKNDTAPMDLGRELSARYLVTCLPNSRYRINQRLRFKVRVARPNVLVLTRSNFIVSK